MSTRRKSLARMSPRLSNTPNPGGAATLGATGGATGLAAGTVVGAALGVPQLASGLQPLVRAQRVGPGRVFTD